MLTILERIFQIIGNKIEIENFFYEIYEIYFFMLLMNFRFNFGKPIMYWLKLHKYHTKFCHLKMFESLFYRDITT